MPGSLADQRDSLGFKPLHIASVRGSKKSVQAGVRYGVHTEAKDARSPLRASFAFAEELLPFSQPEDLSSCLHLAAAVQGGSFVMQEVRLQE